MSGVEVATAYVSLVPSAKGFGAATAAQLGGVLPGAGANAGAAAGAAGAKGFKASFLPGIAVAGAAIAGLAVTAFKLGESFDKAFDTIRLGTGATGAAFDALKDDFKVVLSGVPDSMDDVATAIADVNTRLGLTGVPLQKFSTQMLNLARIAGIDVEGAVASSADVLNNWNVEAGEAEGVLDSLFVVTQATGISWDDLTSSLSSNGVVLRQAGFTIDQSAALLGTLAQNGIDASAVMPRLGRALGVAAEAGIPAQKMLADTFAAIKSAPDDTAAASIAIELFGKKAGPELAALIREGKLGYEELLDLVAGGDETINGAAADVESFGEKWDTLKNQLMVAFEPAATVVFEKLGEALDYLADEGIPRFLDGWGKFMDGMDVLLTRSDGQQKFVEDFSRGWKNLGEDFDRFVDRYHDGWGRINDDAMKEKAEFLVTWNDMKRGFREITKAWDQAVEDFGRGIDSIAKFFAKMKGDFNRGVDTIKDAVNSVVDFVKGIPRRIANVGGAIASAIGDGFKSAWNAIARTINRAIPNSIPLPFGKSIDIAADPMPILHNGGIVPGRPGEEVLAVLEAGERVYSRADVASGTAGGSGMTVNHNYSGIPADRAIELAVARQRRDLAGMFGAAMVGAA